MNGYEQALNIRLDALRAERNKLAEQLGFALESIRQLLALQEDLRRLLANDGYVIKHEPSSVTVARRFLADQEVQS